MVRFESKETITKSEPSEKVSRVDWHYNYVEKMSLEWPSWKKEVYEKNFIKTYQTNEALKV